MKIHARGHTTTIKFLGTQVTEGELETEPGQKPQKLYFTTYRFEATREPDNTSERRSTGDAQQL